MKQIKENKIDYKKYSVGINVFLLLVIIILIFIVIKNSKNNDNKISISHDVNGPFLLTNPILDCEVNNNKNTAIFSKDVHSKVEELKNKYSTPNISFYFRDLNNGSWIGLNEKDIFSPASLLKVPVFMALLHNAEANPSLLDKKVKVYATDFVQDVNPNIVASDLLSIDKEYSLFEIAKSMIQKSDNTAISILIKNIKDGSIDDVFKSIGIPLVTKNNEFEIRVKDYAGFFRVLFNASYLSREMSERALEVLSLSEYTGGIVGGLPKDVTVAHKFGERNIDGSEGNIQLHDCGIVYFPQRPYIFCAMTRGNNFENQNKAIEELSSFIYSEVDKNVDL